MQRHLERGPDCCPDTAGARQAPKVILLEFALVRRGSTCDLPCEEAPEAGMLLEPLPLPRGRQHRQHAMQHHGGCDHKPCGHANSAHQRQHLSEGKTLGTHSSLVCKWPRKLCRQLTQEGDRSSCMV